MGHGRNPFPKSCIHTSARLEAWLLCQQSVKSTSVNSGAVAFPNCFANLCAPLRCLNLSCSLLLCSLLGVSVPCRSNRPTAEANQTVMISDSLAANNSSTFFMNLSVSF